jgi:hypothetical protein
MMYISQWLKLGEGKVLKLLAINDLGRKIANAVGAKG